MASKLAIIAFKVALVWGGTLVAVLLTKHLDYWAGYWVGGTAMFIGLQVARME